MAAGAHMLSKPTLKATRGVIHGEFAGAFPTGSIPAGIFAELLKHIKVPEPAVKKTLSALKVPESVPIDDLFAWLFIPQGCPVDAKDRNRAPEDPVRGGYGWLRKANDEEDRAERRQVSAFTQRAVDCRGYVLGSERTVHLRHVEAMLAGTRLVGPGTGASWPAELSGQGQAGNGPSPLPLPAWTRPTRLSVERRVVLEVSREMAKAGRRVVAVNAASAFHAGGGFSSGGRHALEEALCEQSSIYGSLVRAGDLAKAAGVKPPAWVQPARSRDGGEWEAHIPDDGVVLSPLVEVFRGGTYSGYPFEDEAVALEAVVSVAMPNCNRRMSDSPVDAHPEPAKYEEQVRQKWRAVLTAAAFYTEATCLVVPDAGCGVFYNPPEKLGAAFGCVLREEFSGRFEEVFVAFPGGRNGEAFARAAQAAFEAREDPTNERRDNVVQGGGGGAAAITDDAAAVAGVVWEFSVRRGFEPFTDDCQGVVERHYQAFLQGGPDEGRVPCRFGIIVVNFKTMTQHMEGSSRSRDIRRRKDSGID